jgi:5-formyltetrahydrofolate cyclo-ligase
MKKMISNILSAVSNRSEVTSAEKNKIRKHISELKKVISEAQKQEEANAVFSKIETLPEFKAAKSILLYWSTPDELPTHEAIEKWSGEKQIILPTVVGNDLVLKSYSSGGTMKQGALGIWEPDSSENYTGNIDLVIVPGVAFDSKKKRLGRGKGFYDRFFKNNSSIKIGVGLDFQFLAEVPSTKLDIRMNKVITNSHTIE